jgi:hypothetical protein
VLEAVAEALEAGDAGERISGFGRTGQDSQDFED